MTEETDSTLAAEAARLFAGEITFERGVKALKDLPPDNRIEVAFAGRSNVGKSSLINALAGRKALARTSNTPGRTRELNCFALGSDFRMVDMPGYGYAQAPKTEIRDWTRLVHDYLRGQASLRRVFVLIDARHGIKEIDNAVLVTLDESAVSYQGVLTKVDKPTGGELEKVIARVEAALRKHPAAHPELIVTSSRNGTGIDTLQQAILALRA